MKSEPRPIQPVEADLPLDSKNTAIACGSVLKLDKAGFIKLDLYRRLSQLVNDGFNADEIIGMTSVERLHEEAFEAYSLAYLTWEKPTELSRATLDKNIIDAVSTVDASSLSSAERAQFDAYMVKFKRMMLKAFDLGRHDARSPYPHSGRQSSGFRERDGATIRPMETKTKRSFWRFGGKLDRVYNWLVGLFFLFSCFIQFPRFKNDIPTALGIAVGQTAGLAIILFVLFKIISSLRKS